MNNVNIQIPVAYEEILTIRRNQRNAYTVPPVLYYQTTCNGYILHISDGHTSLRCDLTDGNDISDFETNRISFCNKLDIPAGQLITTNNLADNGTWLAANNSVSVIQPSQGSEYLINRLSGTVDSDVAFGGNTFHVSIWSGLTQACPAFQNTATTYGTPLYDPGNQVYTGWMKVAPSIPNQNWDAWIYFIANVTAYRVIDYRFLSLNDMISKATFQTTGKIISIMHSFKDLAVSIILKSSLNDRIETYLNTNTVLSSPNSVPLQMCATVLEYTEW